MDQRKNMESDAGYGFLARVPVDGSDEQELAVQRGALASRAGGWIEQGMDVTKLPKKRFAWVGRASEVSDATNIASRFCNLVFSTVR